jgi:hypothetical protein
MLKQAQLPIENRAIRFAPGLGKEAASFFWKIWTEGNEIYALSRNSGGIARISVHASGQIHYRLGPKQKQDFAPVMQFGGPSPWLHAFELRFLLSPGLSGQHENESR